MSRTNFEIPMHEPLRCEETLDLSASDLMTIKEVGSTIPVTEEQLPDTEQLERIWRDQLARYMDARWRNETS